MGTWLEAHGVDTPPPRWATAAVDTHPELLSRVHRAYARAGARVHTAATFRASPTAAGGDAARLAAAAVALVRRAVPATHRVAASMAPVLDCWEPGAAPADAERRHEATARLLAATGPDLILVETFADPDEAVHATRAAAATGLPVWTSLTPGYVGDLLGPDAVARAADRVARAGAEVVCVNCLPAARALPWVRALAQVGVPWGVYANAGPRPDGLGYRQPNAAHRYRDLAIEWAAMGAHVVGGCCGTGPAHIAALAASASFCSDRSESG